MNAPAPGVHVLVERNPYGPDAGDMVVIVRRHDLPPHPVVGRVEVLTTGELAALATQLLDVTARLAPPRDRIETCPRCGAVHARRLPGLVLDRERRTVARGPYFASLPQALFVLAEALVDAYPRVARHDWLYERLVGDRPEWSSPEPKLVQVYVSHLRRSLRPLWLGIENVWGVGYELVELRAAGATR